MEKTVRVIDGQGNLLEATYPKRAKGLVKHGRARFVDEQTICLTCPPNRSLEEPKMSEEYQGAFTLNPVEILKRIDEIQHDDAYIMQALETLEKIPSNYSENPGAPEDVAGKAKAEAIVEIAHDRTEFNQKLLDFYIALFEKATQQ